MYLQRSNSEPLTPVPTLMHLKTTRAMTNLRGDSSALRSYLVHAGRCTNLGECAYVRRSVHEWCPRPHGGTCAPSSVSQSSEATNVVHPNDHSCPRTHARGVSPSINCSPTSRRSLPCTQVQALRHKRQEMARSPGLRQNFASTTLTPAPSSRAPSSPARGTRRRSSKAARAS